MSANTDHPAIKPFRDPIHGYIRVTPFEQALIDTPEVQRLRFVLQNSSAYLTYASGMGTRFIHSLGVMHLSGAMFSHALSRSSKADLDAFLKECKHAITDFSSAAEIPEAILKEEWKKHAFNCSSFSHSPVGERSTILSEDQLFIIDTIWQAVRIAGLIHDIGHFPFSHVFEHAVQLYHSHFSSADESKNKALKEEIENRAKELIDKLDQSLINELLPKKSTVSTMIDEIPLHEWNGIRILSFVNFPSKEAVYYKCILRLSKLIFIVNRAPSARDSDNYRSLRCLKTILSSELDADRLDYTMRDLHDSGLTQGQYDLQGILSSLVLVKRGEEFKIFPTDKAISAIESFFYARHYLYKYVIYHHNVARTDGLLEQIIAHLLQEATAPSGDKKIKQLLSDQGFWLFEKESVDRFHFMSSGRFALYDDSWFRTVMLDVYRHINTRKKKPEVLSQFHKILLMMLETFLFRKSDNLWSLWKRDSDVRLFFARRFSGIVSAPGGVDILTNALNSAVDSKEIPDELRSTLCKTLLKEDSVVIIKNIKPKVLKLNSTTFDDELIVKCGSDSFVKVSELSPFLSSLVSAANAYPRIHISVVSEGLKRDSVRINKYRTDIEDILEKNMLKYINQKGGSHVHELSTIAS